MAKNGAGDDGVKKGNGSKSGQEGSFQPGSAASGSKGDKEVSPPKQESDTHAAGEKTSKFIGPGAGNADRNINLTGSEAGGAGESHPFSASGPFLGHTKGNSDRPIDLSRGTGGGHGGEHVAGRGRKDFTGNKGGFPKS